MQQYHEFLSHVLRNGKQREDRTKTGTISVFGYQMRYDLQQGFPLVTTKKVHFKSIVYELLWFLRGESNTKYLKDNGVSIWNEWEDENGNLGRIYGVQWRSWLGANGQTIDQIKGVIEQIKHNPYSRRLIVSAWNVAEIEEMALPPCHTLFQFYVEGGKLSCLLFQRSGDGLLGIPYNIASYALLTHIIAEICGLEVGDFVHTIGDAHIYLNHLEQVNLQLSRQPRELPKLKIKREIKDLDSFLQSATFEDFELVGYKPYPRINAPVAV